MYLSTTFQLQPSMLLLGIWFGLYWVLFSFFNHYIQSLIQFSPLNKTVPCEVVGQLYHCPPSERHNAFSSCALELTASNAALMLAQKFSAFNPFFSIGASGIWKT